MERNDGTPGTNRSMNEATASSALFRGTTSRRSVLKSLAVATGTTAGASKLADAVDGESPSQVERRQVDAGFDGRTWMSDEFAGTPLYQLCFPGVHHAAMYDADAGGDGDWWYTQTRDVYTQLASGIRYLDVRVEAQWDDGTVEFFGHHGGAGDNDDAMAKTGTSLTNEVFPDLRRYLDDVAALSGRELVFVSFSHFWESTGDTDAFEAEEWRAFRDQLVEYFGDYAVDLGSLTSGDLLAKSLGEFDGPKIAIKYDGEYQPWFVGSDFGSPTWLDEPRPGTLYTDAVTERHAGTSTLSGVQWIVTPPAEAIFTSWADSQYDSVYEAADRANDLLPGYVHRVKSNVDLNPNVIMVDFYETSNVVAYCRDLCRFGINTGNRTEDLPVDEAVYTLRSSDSGDVIEVEDGWFEDPYENGADVEEEEYRGDADQRWALRRLADGTYTIEADHSGKVLDVDGWGTDNGDDIHQWDYHGGANQRWYAVPLSDGTYCFVNKHSGRVIDGENPGDNVHQWHYHGGTNQRWQLEKRRDS